MKKLIDMNAPDLVLAGEALLILMAYMKAESNLSLFCKLARRFMFEAYWTTVFDFRVMWFKFKGMTEEEAIVKACERGK
jgi:hypothetical protein